MKTNIKMTNLELTDALERDIETRTARIAKVTRNKERNDPEINFELGKGTKHNKKEDIFFTKIHLINGTDTYDVKAEKPELPIALEVAEGELLRQIKDTQKKRKTLGRKSGRRLKNLFRGFGGKE